jgi:putative ABC transport system substrate-binding protein
MRICLQRREFIGTLGGAAAWPLAARAQQRERVRRIGWLMPFDESDPEGKRRVFTFTQALAGLGWTDGRNVRMEPRWGGDDINRIRAGRRPETTYRRSMRNLSLPETAVCSPTESTR